MKSNIFSDLGCTAHPAFNIDCVVLCDVTFNGAITRNQNFLICLSKWAAMQLHFLSKFPVEAVHNLRVRTKVLNLLP